MVGQPGSMQESTPVTHRALRGVRYSVNLGRLVAVTGVTIRKH